jgi:hypothetical protein
MTYQKHLMFFNKYNITIFLILIGIKLTNIGSAESTTI